MFTDATDISTSSPIVYQEGNHPTAWSKHSFGNATLPPEHTGTGTTLDGLINHRMSLLTSSWLHYHPLYVQCEKRKYSFFNPW